MLGKFKSSKEINAFFNKWHDLKESERLQAIRELRSAGELTAINIPKAAAPEDSFACPLHGFTLTRSCGLTSCQYYIGQKRGTRFSSDAQAKAIAECKNCLINCLDQAKNGRLSAAEVAMLLGISLSEVNNTNTQAIAKVRRATIKEAIEKFHINRYKYIQGHCVNCEVCILNELEMGVRADLTITPYQYGWCSLECKEEKPKWQFIIEKEFSCHYLDALAIGIEVYNIDNLGVVFGVTNDTIKEIRPIIEEHHKKLNPAD